MAFKQVSSLDADVTISVGKTDKATGKPYPKQAEGYYLGNRTVQNKRGESKIHFLQTPKGNLGVWGTTDLDRKLVQVIPGNMVRITSTGTKPTPNGDMYTYKVEVDSDNTIEVSAAENNAPEEDRSVVEDNEAPSDDTDGSDEDAKQAAALLAAERAAKVQAILNRSKTKSK